MYSDNGQCLINSALYANNYTDIKTNNYHSAVEGTGDGLVALYKKYLYRRCFLHTFANCVFVYLDHLALYYHNPCFLGTHPYRVLKH